MFHRIAFAALILAFGLFAVSIALTVYQSLSLAAERMEMVNQWRSM